jgi:hypothetical protein
LKICKEGKNLPNALKKNKPVGSLPKNVASKKKINLKPIELSDEIKQILEKPSEGNEGNQASDNMLKDLNKKEKITNKSIDSNKEDNDQIKLKELIDANKKIDDTLNSLPKKSSVSPRNNNLPTKETKKIQVNLDNKLSRKDSNL